MTTDEILRRVELAKMFVKDAVEALTPIIEQYRLGNVPYDNDPIVKIGVSLKDLRIIQKDLMKTLGSVNEHDDA